MAPCVIPGIHERAQRVWPSEGLIKRPEYGRRPQDLCCCTSHTNVILAPLPGSVRQAKTPNVACAEPGVSVCRGPR
jgi:hypothetical protein